MARFGLIGGSYTSQSLAADAEMTMNFYPEVMESQGARSAMTLYRTPGLYPFADIGGVVLAQLAINGRLFAIGNGALWEIASDGTVTNRGTVNTTGATSAQIVAGNFYVFAVCNGHAYSFKLATNAFTDVTASLAQSSPSLAFFVDGYYGVVFANSNEFQISALEAPTTWNGVDVAQVSVFPENIVGCLTDHREIWFWGSEHAQVYYNSGASNFPLAVIPGAFAEQGLGAALSPVRMDNSIFWLGEDERGQGIAWRSNGYVPVRISNHASEYAWSQYPSGITDAQAYTYQDQGHTFWVIYFPSGNATWVYDAATQMWHQRGHWNGTAQDAHLGITHAYCFSKHLVGSRVDGKIYDMSVNYRTDSGTSIYRTRRAPAVSTELEWMFHRQLVLDAQYPTLPQYQVLTVTSTAPGNFKVAHNLLRAPSGVTIVPTSGWPLEFQTGTQWDDKYVYLNAPASGSTAQIVLWMMSSGFEIVTTSTLGVGDFTVAHTLGKVPVIASIIVGNGQAWFQTPTQWDANNLYMVSGAAGATIVLAVWYGWPNAPLFVDVTATAPGAFTAAHTLGASPTAATIIPTSGAQIWFQSTPWTSTNLNLDAGAAGATAIMAIWNWSNMPLVPVDFSLTWSDDQGNTWSGPVTGQITASQGFISRAIWRRLGRSRSRIYEITVSDPAVEGIVEAYLMAEPGFQPVPRLSKYFGEMA